MNTLLVQQLFNSEMAESTRHTHTEDPDSWKTNKGVE